MQTVKFVLLEALITPYIDPGVNHVLITVFSFENLTVTEAT